MSHSAPETGLGCLRRALAVRIRAGASSERPLVIPVAGGAAGLLKRRECRKLVSLLDPAAIRAGRHSRLRTWLERRQARRSALLLVPDRAAGMRFTGRWRLDLARIRAIPDVHHAPPEAVEAWLASAARGGRRIRPWHAA